MSLQAVGIHPGSARDQGVERITLMYQVPPDDVPDWEKAAGALVAESANFLTANPGEEANAHADALANRAAAIATHSLEFALRTLGAELHCMRALLERRHARGDPQVTRARDARRARAAATPRGPHGARVPRRPSSSARPAGIGIDAWIHL